MSFDDEINKIKPQKLASDMPDEFNGTVKAITRDVKKGQYAGAPLLKVEIGLDNGESFTTSYRIPKAWTDKGQMDLLMKHLKTMGITLDQITGKSFAWKREGLEGSIQGNQRHYPVKLLGKLKAIR
jgi:hypothetical protein